MKVLLQRRMVARTQASSENVISSVGNLFDVSRNTSKFIDSSNPFVCWWSVTNRFVDDLNGARQRDGKWCICGDEGGFYMTTASVMKELMKMRNLYQTLQSGLDFYLNVSHLFHRESPQYHLVCTKSSDICIQPCFFGKRKMLKHGLSYQAKMQTKNFHS